MIRFVWSRVRWHVLFTVLFVPLLAADYLFIRVRSVSAYLEILLAVAILSGTLAGVLDRAIRKRNRS